MEIFKDFGVNPVLLAAQIVNFLIILFILKKFMYKPVLDIIKKRENEIKKGLSDSQDAEKKLADAMEKEERIIKNAHEKAEKIISDAKLEASEQKNLIEENAKKEADRIISEAKAQIDQETKIAEQNLSQKIGQIAVSLLENSLSGLFGKKEQDIILRKARSVLEKSKNL